MTCFRLTTGETIHSWCRRNKVAYCKVFRKIERGYTPDEAAAYGCKNLKKGVPNRKHFYRGKWIGDIYDKQSKAYSRILHRLQHGYTVEQAVEKEPDYELRAA